ncbi:hypothetical protein CcCBS67573_g02833 [Chytriomyces confervae]|uniref:Protein kinase domain-containing protein n=1 Tax=Chytriomyces confervae TaxID=246404 RepID=A0A507FKG4_9FUNG|nr:hypothetical protein CcCBS67573_g02833 [Chytriomyces confervae]
MTESPRLSPMPRRMRDSSVAPSQGDSPISATPTSAFLRRLPLSPAVASSASSYESPTIPSTLSSTLQDSDLVSPRSISSNPYAKLSSATPQSPSISVARSSSTGRSLKEKTGGFLSRLFSSRSKSRERDRGREKDRVRDHPRETSLSSKGSIPSIDNVRFQHVKAVDARTSTKKLISPSNNDFAVMFPSMVRPKDDVPASADTGFKVYTVTVHSFNDTKHVKISESDDGFMVRFEIYKAFQIPASQMSGCFSMYNSKEFHSNNSDLSDDDLFQLCRQTHIPDLILIPTTGRQSETYPKVPQPTKATNEESIGQDPARSTAEHENTPPLPLSPPPPPIVSKKPKPSLHISTSVAPNPVNISETSHNLPVKRVMVETPMTASPSALVGGDPRPRANSSSSQVKFLEDDLKSAESLGTSPVMARRPKRIGTVAKSRLSKQAPIANGIVIQKDVSSSNLGQKDIRSGVSMPRTNRNTNPPALPPVAATMPRSLLPLPPNTTAITSSSKDFIPVAVSSRHMLRHSNAYDDLRQGVPEFGDRPSAPTIVQNLNNFFPSIVVDEKEAAEFSISRSSTSSGENSLSRVGGATSAANSLSGIKIRDGSLLVSKDTVRIMRENSERSVASATSSLGRLAGPSKLGLMSADSADGEEFKEEVTSVVVPGSLRDTHALEVGSPTFSFDYLQNTTLDRSAYATVDRPEAGLDRVPTSSVMSLWRTRADEIAIKRNVTDVWKEKVAGLGSGGLFLSLDAKAIQKPSEGLSPTSEGISPTKSFESDTSQDTDGISPSEEKEEPLHDELLPPLISRRTKRHTWKGFVPQPGVPDDEQLVPYNGEDNLPRQQTSSPVQDELMESSFDNIAIVPPAAEVDVIDHHHHEPHPRSTIDELKAASSAEPSHIKFWKGKMIGQGSFGAVYFGVNIATSELIAVKQVALVPLKKTRGGGGKPYAPLPPSRINKMVDALSVEISLLRELSHDNVVRYLGFDVVENVVSVFLEYVDGGSLATMISRYGRFDYALAQSVTHQVLSGLEYLHDRCIIHRDIKGANILVNRLGVAKIADFGISKKNEYKYQTNSRMSMQGTVYWMAPEVMANKGGYSAKVDIWSLGCVVYEMLQGHAPWKDLNEMQIMWKVGMEHATPPVPASLREDAKEFLERCFVIEPEDRPTATELFSCEFQRVDYLEFNFEEWWNRVESQRLAREAAEEAEEDDDDDEDDDNDSDSFDEMGDSDDSQD